MKKVRIRIVGESVSNALQAAIRAAIASGAAAAQPNADLDAARLTRLTRILKERRGARGLDDRAAADLLVQPALRSAAELLNGDFDALLLAAPAALQAQAEAFFEPQEGSQTARVSFCDCAPDGNDRAPALAWLDWSARHSGAENAARLQIACRWLARCNPGFSAGGAGMPVRPVILDFIGGQRRASRLGEEAIKTASSRMETIHLQLYSGLFYSRGRLQAKELLSTVLARSGAPDDARPRLRLLLSPQLETGEIAAAVQAAGGVWSAALLANSASSVAFLPPDAAAASVGFTLALLRRFRPSSLAERK
jgi:hypothetical protein